MARADEYRRSVYRKHPWDGKKVHVGEETIRSAFCPNHERTTSNFEGVNSNGWLFRCPGVPGEPETAHRFVAQPAENNT